MPHNIEAEQAVLGGVMLAGRKGFDKVSGLLKEESFFHADHRLIWRAIKALAEHEKPFDAVTLGTWLDRKGYGDQLQGGRYLIDLSQTTPSAANIKAYAELVADAALRRTIVQAGMDIQISALESDGRSAVEIAGHAQTIAGGLMHDVPCEISVMSDAVQRVFSELSERHEAVMQGGEPVMDGMPSGFEDWDDILGGFVPGMHVVAGRSKHGKSTVVQNVAEYTAVIRRKPVMGVVLEMSVDQWAKRVMASVGGVDSQRMRRGTLDDFDWTGLSGSVRKLRDAPLYITKAGSNRIDAILAQIRSQHVKTPLAFAFIDYLGLVQVEMMKGENYATAIGRITKAIVNCSQELGIPIIVLVQLNREAEKGRPQASHLKDSGSIEADAESVTFVYREEMNDSRSIYAGTVELIVGLNRNGPPGTCRLLFKGAQYRCEKLPDGWEPERRETAKKSTNTFRRKANKAAEEQE